MVSATILEDHRAALTGHCYRMLGCLTEGEDAVQDGPMEVPGGGFAARCRDPQGAMFALFSMSR